jgi:orotate phosphoribosyltransferase
MSADHRESFLHLALRVQALRFGQYTLKSGRISPYFFNAGAFCTGGALAGLARAYAATLRASGVQIDVLFGPAYKGIPLVAALACALAEQGIDLPYAYNRKEAKDHGEGGVLVGAPLRGRVLIVDDVISAGTSVRESVALIRAQGAEAAAVLIALDRQERGQQQLSAAQEVQQQFGIPVLAVAGLDDLLALTARDPQLASHRAALAQYRADYGLG